ncbi:hypothetical protein J3F81_002989 [Coemansia sp. RSA 371]|nr:hypothetical protein J3F81_002989 [Coemansia sp. RSA 371]
MRYDSSTVNDKNVYWYTRNQQLKETRQKKHKIIRELDKPGIIAVAEQNLAAVPESQGASG